jgi:hypothetical protein
MRERERETGNYEALRRIYNSSVVFYGALSV